MDRSNELLDRFFESYYALRPVNATFIGVHDFDDRLPDYSEQGTSDAVADMEGLLRETERLLSSRDPHEGGPALLDLRLAAGYLETQLWEYRGRHFHRGNPSLHVGEAVFGVLGLFLTDFAPLGERVARATERLLAVPAFLETAQATLGTSPRAWIERALRECRGALAFLDEGVPFLAMECRGRIPEKGIAGFVGAAARAAEAFARYRTVLGGRRGGAEDGDVSAGPEAFDLYMRKGHFVDIPSDEIVRYARHEIAEASRDVDRMARDLGYGSVDGALAELRSLHPAPNRYYERYTERWKDVRRCAEEHDVLTWPEFPIRYIPRPPWCRAAAPDLYFLFYRSPPAFVRPPVHDYLVHPLDPNAPEPEQAAFLAANNDSVITLNHVIHHGSIGHHVQNWHAFRSASRIGRVAAVDCASRIAMYCGGTMAEGWACYATDLMDELGFLSPLESLAERHGRIRMCSRALVDVELHHGRFTLDDAVEWYGREAGMGRESARAEAVKNSMFPGTAAMYMLGTDRIHSLRATLARRQGKDFVLKDFHDRFLSYGSVPVELIARDMEGAP